VYSFSYNPQLREIDSKVLELIPEQLENNWSAESKVHCRLTPEKSQLLCEGKVTMEFVVKKRNFARLSGKEKLYTYFIARLLEKKFEGETLTYLTQEWIDQIKELSNQYLKFNEFFSVIHQMTNNELILFLLDYLYVPGRQREFFSILLGRNKDKEGRNIPNLLEKLDKLLLHFEPIFVTLRSPKRKQFRKGHRDHNSLGSEISRTIREQSQSPEWDLVCEEERKQEDVYLNFLRGFTGSGG